MRIKRADLQVHAKIFKDPVKTFPFVFLLLQDKHVMVKKLLELLVRKVNAKLLESVKLKENSSL